MRGAGRLIGAAALLALAGCASVEEVGGYAFVLRDRYIANTCKEIRDTRGTYTTREKELIGLLEKAESGGIGGALVGATTYRSELAQVRAQLRALAVAEREKPCDAPAIKR